METDGLVSVWPAKSLVSVWPAKGPRGIGPCGATAASTPKTARARPRKSSQGNTRRCRRSDSPNKSQRAQHRPQRFSDAACVR
eukprot:2178382-Lingulodinium_polyedra.AAC.1